MAMRLELGADRFFSLSLDMLCTAGFEGYFVSLNPAWTRTLGWSLEELRLQPFVEFVHPDDRDATIQATQRLQSGTDVTFENRYRHKDGSYRWLLWNATASQDEGLYYAVVRDDTDRHDFEQQLVGAKDVADRASLAKNEFLSRMSHELRTPLTSILGFSQLLEMGGVERKDADEAVRQIRKAGKHLLELINEILDIAKIESGKVSMSIEPVQVSGVVLDAKDLVRPLADQRSIVVRDEGGAPTFALHVLADRQRLKQVLLNLLANAVKYCGGGCTVTVAATEMSGGVLRLAVHDNGPGIAPGLRGRLFTPFERLGVESSGEEGTGMGLALSKRLIDAMGGRIGCESEEGQGTTFWVELPITEAPIERFEREDEGALPAAGGATGTRVSTVLFIEDNLSNVKLISHVLRRRPHAQLIPAMQGSLGVELARKHRPDVVLLDLSLPDMDGRDVLRRLKAAPETTDIPVVVLSAEAAPTRVDELRAAGADGYLTKPLDVKEFLTILDPLLSEPRGGRGLL
jgi:PAS domain S-box-containing protein